MKKPSSTSSGSVKCSCRRAQRLSSAIEASQMMALVYVRAAFSRSVKRSESSKLSSSRYFSSGMACCPTRADLWTPQYSHSIDWET
jgi:hypothetical protein